MTDPVRTRAPHPARAGVLYGVAAYGAWGLFPAYFKAIAAVPALEIVCHRIVWSVAFLAVLTLARRRGGALVAALRSRRTFLTLTATTLLIACNWLIFVWAVAHGQVMQASLGYYINPLINVLLGVVFLRERLRRPQLVSVLLAGAGVLYLTLAGGSFPALGLLMAVTFGLYGLLRKTAHVDALLGLTVETLLLLVPAAGWLAWQMARGQAAFASGGVMWAAGRAALDWPALRLDLLLMAAGPLTAVPLLLFTAAARRLRLATMGILQYLAPTGHFLLAVVAYHEPFTSAHLVAFGCIWTAVALYSVDAARRPSAPAV